MKIFKNKKLYFLRKKIKFPQGQVGDRGKDGQLRETQIYNLVYSDFSSFSLFSPNSLLKPSFTPTREKIFNNIKVCERIAERSLSNWAFNKDHEEEPRDYPEEPIEPDTCIHSEPLGECEICNEETNIYEEPAEPIEKEYQTNINNYYAN